MIIGGIDLETTGLDPEKGHRIIEVGYGLFRYDPATNEAKPVGNGCYLTRVNPGRSIDPAAQAVHGISLSELANEPTWGAVAPTVMKLLHATDLLLAHNMNFDLPFLATELAREGYEVPPDLECLCTAEKGRAVTPMGNFPSLKALCWAMDVDYDDTAAHAADYDIMRTMEAFFTGITRGLYALPILSADGITGQKVA